MAPRLPRAEVVEARTPLERYRSGLAIDQDDLGDGLVRQPELYEHVGQGLAMAVAERDAAKLDLEIAQAAVAQQIREDAAKLKEKMTEGSVGELTLLDADVQKAHRRLNDCKRQVDSWAALKESYQQRSYMLRECVSIHLARMGASPSMSRRESPAQAYAEDVHDRAGKLREERGYKPRRAG